MGLISWLIVGGLAGWIASLIMKRDADMGIVANIICGLGGSVGGGWVVGLFAKVPPKTFSFSTLLTSILGAVIVLAIVNLIKRGRAR